MALPVQKNGYKPLYTGTISTKYNSVVLDQDGTAGLVTDGSETISGTKTWTIKNVKADIESKSVVNTFFTTIMQIFNNPTATSNINVNENSYALKFEGVA